MNEKNTNLKNEVWGHFKNMQTVVLATCDMGQPRVRPVTMIYYDGRFWIGTGTNDAKVKQMKENNRVEFSMFVDKEKNIGCIRGLGVANIIQDSDTKKKLSERMPYFKEFWKGPDDPSYTLCEIVIKQIEYLKPGALKIEKFTL